MAAFSFCLKLDIMIRITHLISMNLYIVYVKSDFCAPGEIIMLNVGNKECAQCTEQTGNFWLIKLRHHFITLTNSKPVTRMDIRQAN